MPTSPRSSRLRTGRAPLLVAAALLVVAPQAVGAADGPPAGPLTVSAATVRQDGPDLVWRATLGARLGADDLTRASGRTLCLQLGSGGRTTPREQVCVRRTRPGRPLGMRLATLAPDGRIVAARRLPGSLRAGGTTVTARFGVAAVGLSHRRYRWQDVATSTADGGCREADGRCAAAVPARPRAARTVRPTPTGCVSSGARQVTGAPGRPREVALTFDDGPGVDTSRILHVLERQHVPATFFVVGKEVAGRGALLRRALEDGDAIGNHSFTHANLAGGGDAGEITRTQQAVRGATGYTPCLVRPPYGATSGALVSQLHGLGLTSVLWNVDPQDWSTPGTGAIVSRIRSQARAGSIVLMHDGGGPRGQTVAALPQVIRLLRARHLRFRTVPQLLHLQARYGS